MGESNVFTIQFNKLIGIGINFEWCFTTEDNKRIRVLSINLSLPFIFCGIYFRKSNRNDWI